MAYLTVSHTKKLATNVISCCLFKSKSFLLIVFVNFYIQVRLGSQHYFYMETHSALAIPDEDNCMVVYSSSQWPANVHSVIAKCLGVPEHNVRVITRRVGGGFGGKGIKSMVVSICCQLYVQFTIEKRFFTSAFL